MFKTFKNILGITSQVVKVCESQFRNTNNALDRLVIREPRRSEQKLCFSTSRPRMKSGDEISKRKSVKEAAAKDLIDTRDTFHQVGISYKRYAESFPTADLPYRLFDGIPFKDVPIVHIKCSRNNTILLLSVRGDPQVIRSCGCDGFKNSRKGTNIAAQTTGVSFAQRAVKKGYKTIRVLLRGFGPGRLSAMKGLELGGMNIISITDNTVDASNLRPRKQRRL